MRCRAERQWIQQSRGILRKVIPSAVEGSRCVTLELTCRVLRLRCASLRMTSSACPGTRVVLATTRFLFIVPPKMRSDRLSFFCGLFFLLTRHAAAASAAADPKPNFIKGMTVSAQTWGWEWATPEMACTLDELKSLGVNSVDIHPYAQIEN